MTGRLGEMTALRIALAAVVLALSACGSRHASVPPEGLRPVKDLPVGAMPARTDLNRVVGARLPGEPSCRVERVHSNSQQQQADIRCARASGTVRIGDDRDASPRPQVRCGFPQMGGFFSCELNVSTIDVSTQADCSDRCDEGAAARKTMIGLLALLSRLRERHAPTIGHGRLSLAIDLLALAGRRLPGAPRCRFSHRVGGYRKPVISLGCGRSA
jgi:hypothetical protein